MKAYVHVCCIFVFLSQAMGKVAGRVFSIIFDKNCCCTFPHKLMKSCQKILSVSAH